jgi:hypothetical protein
MSNYEQPSRPPYLPGHQFQHVQISEGARAHLGDTYNISQFLPDSEEEYHERLTGYRSRKPA